MKEILASVIELAKESDGNTRIVAIAALSIVYLAVSMKS